jgi:hypothetical protein
MLAMERQQLTVRGQVSGGCDALNADQTTGRTRVYCLLISAHSSSSCFALCAEHASLKLNLRTPRIMTRFHEMEFQMLILDIRVITPSQDCTMIDVLILLTRVLVEPAPAYYIRRALLR